VPALEESNPWLAETLRKRAGAGADAAEVSDALSQLLRQIDAGLTPVIGRRGVALLYKRAVFLSVPSHPWMAGTHGAGLAMDFVALEVSFAVQAPAAAADGGSALLQRIYDLLTNLVGLALTEQLLRGVWANPSSHARAQDTST